MRGILISKLKLQTLTYTILFTGHYTAVCKPLLSDDHSLVRGEYSGQFNCVTSPKKRRFIESGEYCCNYGQDSGQSLLKEQK